MQALWHAHHQLQPFGAAEQQACSLVTATRPCPRSLHLAVRMVVLLHAYQKGFTAMEVAIMFSFYEVGGWWVDAC